MIIRDIKGRFVKGYTRAITWNTGLKGEKHYNWQGGKSFEA